MHWNSSDSNRGKVGKDQPLKTVEVLNTETGQWHTAPDLPQPLAQSSLTLCGDLVYLFGGFSKHRNAIYSVYTCSLSSLLSLSGFNSLGGRLTLSSKGSIIWNRVADLPCNCLHCCDTSWSTVINWWAEGFKRIHHSCSYVPANH